MTDRKEMLIVDDNIGDAMLLRESFSDTSPSVSLSFARDGREALDILRGDGTSSTHYRPNMIVLDLKMPGMDGLSLLKELRADPLLACIRVVVLTGSDAPEDREMSRSLGASSYFTKPSKMDDWHALTIKLERLASSKERMEVDECIEQ